MTPRRFTDEQEREIVNEYKNGVSSPALAKRLGTNPSTISSVLKRQGVQPQQKERTCAACGRSYIPAAFNQLWCSDDCRLTGGMKACEGCGVMFRPVAKGTAGLKVRFHSVRCAAE